MPNSEAPSVSHSAPIDRPIPSRSGRLTYTEMLAYGLGGYLSIALMNSVGQLTGLILNVELGISVVLVGLANFLPRLWDAFSDPLMGNISDNTRSRWGRRRPYILFGGIATAVTFVVMWSVPRDWTEINQYWYFLVTSMFFWTALTVFEIPHGALGMEMTDDYHERTRLFSAKSFVGNVGAIVTPWFYALATLPFFRGDGNIADGMRAVSYIAATLVIVPVVICVVVCKERHPERVAAQRREPIMTSMRITLVNRTFLRLVAVIATVALGFNFVNGIANYITVFYLYGGNKDAASVLLGWGGSVWAITAVVAVFPLNWASKLTGKTNTLLIAIGFMAGAQVLKIVCYNPAMPYLTLVPTAMLSAGMLMFFTLANAMVADVCAEDELRTGTNTSGAYYAVFWWFLKLGTAGAMVVSATLIEATGFDEDEAVQTDSTLLWLRVVEICIPIVLCVVAAFALRGYSLNEARMREVKGILDARDRDRDLIHKIHKS